MAASPAAGANCRVLIVEDDAIIAGNLYTFLEARGFLPDTAYSGPAALQRLAEQRFDALILDIGLPGMDGNAVLHTLRNDRRLDVPVLMLTARDSLEDKLAGFSHGADDYLTKPFALLEVEARLLALIQRAKGATVDSVSVNGNPVHLTRKAVLIIDALLRDPGRVVSREELESVLWGNEPPSSDALRSQVHLLRRALADAGFDGIETVHGTGWRLSLDGGTAP
jgi:DNA-binding response OmpR family regulator